MSSLFDAVKSVDNETVTENAMKAYKSTLKAVLDLFQDGFSYRRNPERVNDAVRKAALEDKALTLKCLFYLRDIHEGQGEREVFRSGMRTFLSLYPEAKSVLHLIPVGSDNKPYGRWDDLVALLGVSEEVDKAIFGIISKQFIADQVAYQRDEISKISLLAKWLPSCNTSSPKTRALGQKVWRGLNMTSERHYRKVLSALRKAISIVETKISNKDYTFDYSKLPSYAAMKYKAAFCRNDEERYKKYLEELSDAVRNVVTLDSVKINTATLYPYDVVRPILNNLNFVNSQWTSIGYKSEACYNGSEETASLADSQWRSLRDYFKDAKETNWLAVVDVSGSMFDGYVKDISSIEVATSLGLYVAERNEGAFKNQLITFSSEPSFITVDDNWSLKDKLLHIASSEWGNNTNLAKVFNLVLRAAVEKRVLAKDMPDVIMIISDMQFDCAVADTDAMEMIENDYRAAGYKMPKLVFWNACARANTSKPITYDRSGAILVGGCKPGIVEQVLSAKSPIEFMESVLNSERYSEITV